MTDLTSIWSQILDWWEMAIDFAPELLLGIIVFIIFIFLGKGLRKTTKKAVDIFSDSQALIELSGTIVYFVTLIVGLAVVLAILNLDEAVTSLLAGVGIIGLALGFAFQDIISNFIAGAALSIRKDFEVGHYVVYSDIEGIVQDVSLRNTVIKTFQGQIVTVPNKLLFENPVKNFTTSGEWRVEIPCGVAYDTDLDTAMYVAKQAVSKIEERDQERPIEIYYTEFGDSSINFSLRFWIKFPEQDFLQARSEAIQLVKEAFDKEGIDIPFPIRTMEIINSQSAQAGKSQITNSN